MSRFLSLFVCACLLPAQTPEGPAFEVASFKKVGQTSPVIQPMTGGPGTPTPTRAHMIFIVPAFLSEAFGLPGYRIVGASVPNDFYEFVATVPEGATKDEFRTMLRNLLVERFHLKYHRETREMKRYELRVADSGHKLKRASAAPPPEVSPGFVITTGADGYSVLPLGRSVGPTGRGGRWAMQRVKTTMDDFVRDVENQLRGPVVNLTNLAGEFDFSLRWMAVNPAPPGVDTPEFTDPPFLPSLREQLGLVVREGMGPTEVVVIDAIDREAAPN